jgi:putative FmdB family regulatory protein
MPYYEYFCAECRKRVSIFQRYEEYGRLAATCPKCGGSSLRRLISRVRVARSEDAQLDALADPGQWGDVDENDPRSMARALRKMGREMGEDLPAEFNEVVGRLEAGEKPEEIERSMPDLGLGEDSELGE